MRRQWGLAALLIASAAQAQQGKSLGEKTQSHHIVVPLTSKGLSGIVSGDASKPGEQFVIRIYNDANFIVLPHWHPMDEHITVVKGTWYLGTGDTFDPHAMRQLNVGDYAMLPKQMPHFAWSKTDTIILVHGIGPFQQTNTDAQQSLSGWTVDPQKGIVREPRSASYFKFKLNDHVRSDRGNGVIAYGQHSEKNKVTQYLVQKAGGTRFCETEDHLSLILATPRRSDSGPLTGTWEGTMRGIPQGDLPFTIVFEQNGEHVSGVISFFFSGGAFQSSTFRRNRLELHVDSPLADFVFNAEYRAGAISGQWSTDERSKGTWEARKITETPGLN